MRYGLAVLSLLSCWLGAVAHAETPTQLARFDWAMQCQGCHGSSGENSHNGVPVLQREVAKFLSVEGGRAFLVQVPGVANAPLDNGRLAGVMNWMLREFDPTHLPVAFRPYTAQEVGRLRQAALDLEVAKVRLDLVRRLYSPRDRERTQREKTQ